MILSPSNDAQSFTIYEIVTQTSHAFKHTSLDNDTEPKYIIPVCKTMLGNHVFSVDLGQNNNSM